jgi:hypothetical protein
MSPCALCPITQHPIIFFRRYSKITWTKPLVKMSPNCLTVLIFSSWKQFVWIFLQNQIVLVTWYLLHGVNCGGKVFTKPKASRLSSWTTSFIVVSVIGRFTELITDSTILMIRNRSLQHADNAMISASIVERAVSVCSCNFQRIGTSENVMPNHVWLFTHDESTGFLCPYILTKLASG